MFGIVRGSHRVGRRLQDCLDVGHQVGDTIVFRRRRRRDRHCTHDLEIDLVEPDMEGHVIGQPAVGRGDEPVGRHLVGMGRGQDVHVPRGVEVDAAPGPPGGKMHRPLEHHPLAVLRVEPAHQVDGLARGDVLAQHDLVVGPDGDGGIPVEVLNLAAKILTGGIVIVVHLAAGHQESQHRGVLGRIQGDAPVGPVHHQLRGPGNHHPAAVRVGPADHLDGVEGREIPARFLLLAGAVGRHAADQGLAGGRDPDGARLVGPDIGLARQRAVGAELLGNVGAGRHVPHDPDVGAGRDAHQRAAPVRGVARGRESAGGVDHHAQAVVVRPGCSRHQFHAPGRGDARIQVDLLARLDVGRGIGPGPDDPALADLPARHDGAKDVHVLGPVDGDGGPGLGRGQPAGAVHVDARALGVGPAPVGAVRLQAAVKGHVTGHVGKPFPVDPLVRLDGQVRILAEHVDVAPHDHVFSGCHRDAGIVHQRGQRPGQKEAEPPVAGEIVTRLDVEQRGIAVIDLEDVGLAVAVGDRPALRGRHHRDGDRAGQRMAVVDKNLPQVKRHGSPVQFRDEAGHHGRAEQILARNGVEIVSEVVEGAAHGKVHVAADRHRPADPHLVGTAQVQVRVRAGDVGHRRPGGIVEIGPGGHGRAGQHVQKGGRIQVDAHIRMTPVDQAPFQHGDGVGAVHVDGGPLTCGSRLARRAGADLDLACDPDGAGGVDVHQALVVTRLDDAAHVGGQAVGAVVIGDQRVVPRRAVDVQMHEVVAHDPAGDHHLLVRVKGDLPGRDPGIGHAHGVVEVPGVDLDEIRVKLHPVHRGLHIPLNVNRIAEKLGPVAQGPVDHPGHGRVLDLGGVLDVADAHGVARMLVADGYQGEVVGDGRHVPQ